VKTKILFLINDLSGGGAEKVLVNLVNNMDHQKFDITLRTLVDTGVNKSNLKGHIHYESVFHKAFRGLNFLDRIPGIYQFVCKGKFDIIIVYLHGVLTRIVSYAPQEQKTIAFLHANMHESDFMKDLVRRNKADLCFRNYNRIVAVSESVRESFIEVTGISERTCVKYNTFNILHIQESAKENNYHLLKNPKGITLCSVGKLESVKGFDRMIRVLARLKENGIFYTWNVIGEGVERSNLEKMVTDYKITNQVLFCGYDNNPYKYIANCDLFVCSSYSEGFSSVVAESIIIGTPVLTTDCAGMKEMLGEKNEYGIVVNNDEDSLYHMLQEIAQDTNILATYKDKVKNRSSFFSVQHTVSEIEKMLDEVLE